MKLYYCPSCRKVFYFGPLILMNRREGDPCPNCYDGRVYHSGKSEEEISTYDIKLKEVPLKEIIEAMLA